MAKVTKRGKGWQIDYYDPHGKRIRRSFKKKKDAVEELAKRVSLIAEGRYLDVKKDLKITLKELTEKYTENYTHSTKKHYCDNFHEYFGKDTLLSNIKYVDLETYRNHLRRKLTVKGTVRKDSTVNREMSCLHHIFSKAVEWEMVEQSPFDKGKSLILKENNKRLRFLTEDEIKNLLENCPPYLHKIANCALNTGMRKGEILSLKWSQVRNGFIYLMETKTKEPREIPINEDLDEVFKQIKSEQDPKSDKVIGLDGKPVKTEMQYFQHVFSYKERPIKGKVQVYNILILMVGARGFEPPTP